MKTDQKKISVIIPNAPASWPGVSVIQTEFIQILQNHFSKLKKFDFLDKPKASIKDDVWIFPAGSVQVGTLKWLRQNYPRPEERPPAVFLWGGEGAKLGYHIWHFRDVFRFDDQWVVGCQAEKNLLDYWFPNNNRTHVMFHPVAQQFVPVRNIESKKDLRHRLELPATQKIMLYAGRLSQQKNILPLLDLLDRFPKVKLLVCGDTDSVGVPHLQGAKAQHVPSALMEAVGDRRLSSRIEFRPFQSQVQLRSIMQACDYQVSLSAHYGEDFGYSIAQGLCCGLKTILSEWGGHHNWKSIGDGGHLSYVELDWTKNIEVGIPLLKKNIFLPKSAVPKDFIKSYRLTVQNQLMQVLNNAVASSGHLQTRADLIHFWEMVKKVPQPQMFSSPEHPLFQNVIKAYQGRSI